MSDAWRRHDAGDPDAKARLVLALERRPQDVPADRGAALLALALDAEVNPDHVSAAAWHHLVRDTALFEGPPETVAAGLEANELALALLREAPVMHHKAEAMLTSVRGYLLLARRWATVPKLTAALHRQAALNDGAWEFDDEERRALTNDTARAAYLPERTVSARAGFADAVTRAVAEQYEAWPYPRWTRITRRAPTTFGAAIGKIDPDGRALPTPAEVLIAGCGTGHQAALLAQRYPRDRFTAIDLSAASLAIARERCAANGIGGIDFRRMDLHDVASLGKRFDVVTATGVLHHLPDPEAGWAALTAVLKPGGVMQVMLYSRVARMRAQALRRMLGTLPDGPIDADVLRAARWRMLKLPQATIPTGRDFFSLSGVHDLLLHRHEDPFDVPRIRRAVDTLGLELLHFAIPDTEVAARYHAEHPGDPLQRDFGAWAALERARPSLFVRMYDFWCRKKITVSSAAPFDAAYGVAQDDVRRTQVTSSRTFEGPRRTNWVRRIRGE